ncbi:hypothetical protein M6B38_318655 [Iris pallida]|uniref:Uncharacterized protein n=1 Tax=Iris pallida TaxID=29817 RepID=A0AAX6HCA6_IRIPA|nr:hypothetical protein M6B38_318650 [Iris pallida]KAJ6838680.1 hypothetical protein M6B38_318655 [Iris pallida]
MMMVVVVVKFKPPISSVPYPPSSNGEVFLKIFLQPFVKMENEENWDQHNMNVDCSRIFWATIASSILKTSEIFSTLQIKLGFSETANLENHIKWKYFNFFSDSLPSPMARHTMQPLVRGELESSRGEVVFR